MKIHEYQAKRLLESSGIAVPRGLVATSAAEAAAAAKTLLAQSPRKAVVVKAQIHAGGRGKGRFRHAPSLGGISLGRSAKEVATLAKEMLGHTLSTQQTGPQGKVVHTLLVEETVDIARELYLGLTIDRGTRQPVVMACAEGGMDIETIAAHTPEKILRETYDPAHGLYTFQARRLAFALGLTGPAHAAAVSLLEALAAFFVAHDAALVEINPLVVTTQGDVMPLDAKINFDDNAAFRHADWSALRDPEEEEPTERRAQAADLSYVKLDGTIGCMVNGAGLAMATMDIIATFGGRPANFLDVGGAADATRVKQAFQIILADARVRAVLINIFGGIVHCDVLAEGVLAAVSEAGVRVPLIVRLEGTNVAQGKAILASSGVDILAANTMAEAARLAVEAAR